MKKALRNIIAIIAISFITAILFVSCNDAGNEKQEYKELETGDTAPDFEVELLSGETVKLSDYKDKAVFVNFWATWCGPCVEELPAIQKLSETFADELVVLEINCSEKKDKVVEFISKTDYKFSVGLDEDSKIQEKYPTMGIPYTVIIDADGIITSIHLGASGDMFPVYEEAVKEALGILKAKESELDEAEVRMAYENARLDLWLLFYNDNLASDDVDVEIGEKTYKKLEHITIKTMAGLKTHLESMFSDEIVDNLLNMDLYHEIDGELYIQPAVRINLDFEVLKDNQTVEIIEENGLKFICRITEKDSNKKCDMIYEYVSDKWLFTQFELFLN